MNARPNRVTYKVVTRNCADFVREVLDFYYPKSVRRGSIADLGVSTPKHAAKSLARYGKHHRDLEFTHFVIPQVPGTVKRSRPVRGVLESLFRAKKYVVVLAAFHPIVAGGVLTVDLVGDRFNPARNSVVFSLTGDPQAPPTNLEKRAYLRELQAAATRGVDGGASFSAFEWRNFVEKAQPEFDADGQPVLQVSEGAGWKDTVELGVARSDLQSEDAPWELQRELMVARLKQTLAHSRAPRISSNELREDWLLLEKIDDRAILSKTSEQGNQTVIQ
jgi:hypothetical protein